MLGELARHPGAASMRRAVRRRAFNEFVLDSGHTHSLAPTIAGAVRAAFRAPTTDVESIRAAMRRTMRAVDFGEGVAPDHIAADLEYLAGLVQNPLRRMLLGSFAGGRRLSPLGIPGIRATVLLDSLSMDGTSAILIDHSKTSFVAQ